MAASNAETATYNGTEAQITETETHRDKTMHKVEFASDGRTVSRWVFEGDLE